MKVWLDDLRPAPEGWVHAYNARQAMDLLKTRQVEEMSMDHDLGHCVACEGCEGYKASCGCECHWSGYSVAVFMAANSLWPKVKPTVHSANPAGARNMIATIDRYFPGNTEKSGYEPAPPGQRPGITFELRDDEYLRARRFIQRHNGRHPGWTYTYRFEPNGYDVITSIVCNYCKKKKSLT